MLGILGGTFDPIHHGHLRTALDVAEAVGLDEVRLIPLRHAVHRDQPETPAALRLAMVRAAIAGSSGRYAESEPYAPIRKRAGSSPPDRSSATSPEARPSACFARRRSMRWGRAAMLLSWRTHTMLKKIGLIGGGNIGGVLAQEIFQRKLARYRRRS